MKFIACIASMMLIVLISQHSIIGLPVTSTVVDEPCLEGYEKIKGVCTPINSKLTDMKLESTSLLNDIKMESSSLPSGNVLPKEGNPIAESTTERFSTCSEGMEKGKDGSCQPIKVDTTSEMNVVSTTGLNENVGGVENPTGCPKGMKFDEQGACQEIEPSKLEKNVFDPKVLLKKDGSCPDDYKMIENQCLYIAGTKTSTMNPSSLVPDHLSNRMQAKSGTGASIKDELVRVLSNNSCPEGTEYFDNGLCRKRDISSISNHSCPDNYELMDGKCEYKKNKAPISNDITTTIMPESTTLVERTN